MGLTFSEEHEELRHTVRGFLDKHASESDVRRLMATDEGYDPELWLRLAGMGLLGLGVPEEFGGAGCGWAEVSIVLEEAGRALLCAPYYATVVLGTAALLASGDKAAQGDYLPGIVSGARIATLAIDDESADPPGGGVVVATERHGGWTLSGQRAYVLDGYTADLVLVIAGTPAGTSLFAVEGDAAGLTRAPLPMLDLTRKQARLDFADTPARLVGAVGTAHGLRARVLDLAAVGLAAEQVGGAARALEMAVEYAKVRHQFGRPIGSFQAVKHMCADMLVEVEFARSAAYHAVWAADEAPEELPVAASLAKAYCSDAFFAVAAQNIQVHGGVGFTWEHPAHLYLKRAKTDQILLGDATYHRGLLATRVGI